MTATTRVERDSMGPLEVPATALWGAQTQRAIENFPPSGLRMPRAFIRALALIKHSAAGANAELGDLPQAVAAAIADPALVDAALVCVFAGARVPMPFADRCDRCLEPAATPCH